MSKAPQFYRNGASLKIILFIKDVAL